jgi:hypothetical protein
VAEPDALEASQAHVAVRGGKFVIGQDSIPVAALSKIMSAVGIAKVQEQLVRCGRMSTEDMDEHAWSVLEEEPGSDGLRHFVVVAERIKPRRGGRPQYRSNRH